MSDEEHLTPELQALLTAEREAPGPDAGAHDRVARKLASTLGVTLAAAGASTAATSGAQTVLPKALVGKSLAAKLMVAAIVGGVGAGGVAATVALMHRHARQAAPQAPAVAPPMPSVPPAPMPPVPAVATAPANVPSLAAVAPGSTAPSSGDARASTPHHAAHHAAAAIAAKTGATKTSAAKAHDDLEVERALLADARNAMQMSDAPRALAILDDHARRFAGGQLAEERDALRVAALWLSGDHEGARRHADEFARRHPDSLFLPSVKRAVAE
ncbi:MAG TPA: hypothetical protein VN947_01695 [Polyangia bacterium]|nr:hypothetical protein [Polyangia bacterium]